MTWKLITIDNDVDISLSDLRSIKWLHRETNRTERRNNTINQCWIPDCDMQELVLSASSRRTIDLPTEDPAPNHPAPPPSSSYPSHFPSVDTEMSVQVDRNPLGFIERFGRMIGNEEERGDPEKVRRKDGRKAPRRPGEATEEAGRRPGGGRVMARERSRRRPG